MKYFSEFKLLKKVQKDFWLTNSVQFFDGMAYFSMMNVITLYLTSNIGLSDALSGTVVGWFSLAITICVLLVGTLCDKLGIKKSFLLGLGILLLSRLSLGILPEYLNKEYLFYPTVGLLLLMAIGTAFMSPVTTTAIRSFTTQETRSIGFNIYYLIMNIGAILSGFAVTDGLRTFFGGDKGNLAILVFGALMSFFSMISISLINENNSSEIVEKSDKKTMLQMFLEVWQESAFRKLLIFLVLTIGVRLIFTHQFLIMPKYYLRVLGENFQFGMLNSINPIIIVVGLMLIIPILKKFQTYNLLITGMFISAFSLIFLVIPPQFFYILPGIDNLSSAYLFMILAQILVFAFGELIFSPRFTEYVAMVAPKDKVNSYMSLSALPTFISKPVNGMISGYLISKYCYVGIGEKLGTLDYVSSPEFMWLIYFVLAIISPISLLLLKKRLSE